MLSVLRRSDSRGERRDLNDAHNEILRLQGVKPEEYGKFDWPEWSGPANSIRWAERRLNKQFIEDESAQSGSPMIPSSTAEGAGAVKGGDVHAGLHVQNNERSVSDPPTHS